MGNRAFSATGNMPKAMPPVRLWKSSAVCRSAGRKPNIDWSHCSGGGTKTRLTGSGAFTEAEKVAVGDPHIWPAASISSIAVRRTP
jgi:hypothetical protein